MLPPLLCGISFGLGAAVKWSCICSAAEWSNPAVRWDQGFIKSSGFAGYPQKACKACFGALYALSPFPPSYTFCHTFRKCGTI